MDISGKINRKKTAKINPAGLILFWRLPVPLPGVHALLDF